MDDVRMTAEDLARLQAELKELETNGRAAIAARIKTAREWGDLKENAEYHDAKNEQAGLETKILKLRDQISRAAVQEVTTGDVVGFGSTVTVRDTGSGRESTYTLVTETDADPPSGKISAASPLARALEGATAGDVVTFAAPRGERALEILSIA